MNSCFHLWAHSDTDASSEAFGAVLEQEDEQTKSIKPIAYYSQKLQGAQINYPTHDKELCNY